MVSSFPRDWWAGDVRRGCRLAGCDRLLAWSSASCARIAAALAAKSVVLRGIDRGFLKRHRQAVSSKSSRPISMRRISLVPAPIS